jgi:hypothetical protein
MADDPAIRILHLEKGKTTDWQDEMSCRISPAYCLL